MIHFKYYGQLFAVIILGISLYSFSRTLYAIDVPISPASVEPGQIGQTLYRSGAPTSAPAAITQLHKATEKPSIEAAAAAKITFVLNGIHFKGNHVFSSAELLKIFTPYLHKKITVAKLIELVEAATQKYQKAGYFLSKALLPQQEIHDGIVTVQIVEGFISNVDIQGIKGQNKTYLLKYAHEIESIRPIKLDKLERYLLLINDNPGIQAKAVLAPDPKVPLGSKMTLVSQFTPVQATISRDNYQTRFLGPLETSIYGSFNSMIIPGGSLYGRALAADPYTKLQYYEARHSQFLGTDGWLLTLDGYYTRTNPQFVLAPLHNIGYSADGNAALLYPIIRSRARNLRVQGQFDYINSHATILEQPLYYDRIRDLVLSSVYDDTLWKGQDVISVALNKGFNIWGATAAGPHSRLGSTPNYLKLNGTVSRLQNLTSHFDLYAMVTGQWTNHTLFATEVFTFGGPYLGRGYDMSQFTSDEAVAGTFEFRINFNPNLKYLKQAQFYTFYDAGKFWNKSHLIPLTHMASAASMGFGTRSAIMPHVYIEGFFGRALTTRNATQVILHRDGRTFLGYMQVSLSL